MAEQHPQSTCPHCGYPVEVQEHAPGCPNAVKAEAQEADQDVQVSESEVAEQSPEQAIIERLKSAKVELEAELTKNELLLRTLFSGKELSPDEQARADEVFGQYNPDETRELYEKFKNELRPEGYRGADVWYKLHQHTVEGDRAVTEKQRRLEQEILALDQQLDTAQHAHSEAQRAYSEWSQGMAIKRFFTKKTGRSLEDNVTASQAEERRVRDQRYDIRHEIDKLRFPRHHNKEARDYIDNCAWVDFYYRGRQEIMARLEEKLKGEDVDNHLKKELPAGGYLRQIVEREAGPILEELVRSGVLDPERAEAYRVKATQLMKYSMRPQEEVESNTWTVYREIGDIIDSCKVKQLPDNVSPKYSPRDLNSALQRIREMPLIPNKDEKTASNYYSTMLAKFISTAYIEGRLAHMSETIEAESTLDPGNPYRELIATLRIRNSRRDQSLSPDVLKFLDIGPARWQIMGKTCIKAGLITGEEWRHLETAMIEEVGYENLERPVRSAAGNTKVALQRLGNPEALPYLANHARVNTWRLDETGAAIEALARNASSEQLDRILPRLTPEARAMITEALDENSLFNSFTDTTDPKREDVMCRNYELQDLYPVHSHIATQLRAKERDTERVRDYYLGWFERDSDLGVQTIEKTAREVGEDPKTVVEAYFPHLLERLVYSDSSNVFLSEKIPLFLKEYARVTQSTPKEVWEALSKKMSDIKKNARHPEDFIKTLTEVADITGVDRTEMMKQSLPYLMGPLRERGANGIESVAYMDQVAAAFGVDRDVVTAACLSEIPRGDAWRSHNAATEDNIYQTLGSSADRDIGRLAAQFGKEFLTLSQEDSESLAELFRRGSLQASAEERTRLLRSITKIQRPGAADFLPKLAKAWTDPSVDGAQVSDLIEQFIICDELGIRAERNPEEGVAEAEIAEMSLQGMESGFLRQIRQAVAQDAQRMLDHANRHLLKKLFGDEQIEKFLAALPKASDERRNAFTHNEYDRTTTFIKFLAHERQSGMKLDAEEWPILTEYVKRFGLSRTPVLYKYFKNLFRHEKYGDPLPQYQIDSGITTTEELDARNRRIRDLVFSEQPMTDVRDMPPFDLEILDSVSGKSTHRFSGGRPSMSKIVTDFAEAQENKTVAPLPEGYEHFTMNLSNVEVQVQAEQIEKDFTVLRDEMLEVIAHPGDISDIRQQAVQALSTEIATVAESQRQKGDNPFIVKRLEELRALQESVVKANDSDALVGTLLSLDLGTSKRIGMVPLIRKLMLHKLFERHYSALQADQLSASISQGPTADGILRMLNIHDDFIKDHLLNVTRKNEEKYWSKETWDKIQKGRKSNKLVNLTKVFDPHISALREASSNFEIIEKGGTQRVEAIPDRGLVGELSGYLADVCYTAEYPLLEKYPSVVPYKFVARDAETGSPAFVGSVLVFEVTTSNGDPALLVRGFDVPNEQKYDIGKFIEKFIDQLTIVAQKRGIKKVLVPGLTGATSNYAMTNRHVESTYKTDKTPVGLAEPFDFNNYNLTENCYVVREIGDQTAT
ncbi:MAG: hypothetical protein V1685_06110 [Parcubacteria group bacterium]